MPTEDCSSRSTFRTSGPLSSAPATRSHPPTTFEHAERRTAPPSSTLRLLPLTRIPARTARQPSTFSTLPLATLVRHTLRSVRYCRTQGSSTRMCRLEGIWGSCGHELRERTGKAIDYKLTGVHLKSASRCVQRGARCLVIGQSQWTVCRVSSAASSSLLKSNILHTEELKCRFFALVAVGRS